MKHNTLVRTLGGDTCVAVGFMEDGALVQFRKLGGAFSPIWFFASALKKVPNPAEVVVEYINTKLVGGGTIEWAGKFGLNGVTVAGRKTIAVEFVDGQTVNYNYRDILQALHSGYKVFYDDLEVVDPTYENDWLEFSGGCITKLNEETVKNLNVVQPLIGE